MEFFKKLTVYHYMVIVLSVNAVLGINQFGLATTLPNLMLAIVVSVAVDTAIHYVKRKNLRISLSAIITGFFVGTILDFNTPLLLVAVTALVAILSKLIKVRGRHLFNPASFGLMFSLFLFKVSHSWWAATTVPLANFSFPLVVFILGLFIAYKIKGYQAITFLIIYLALFSAYFLSIASLPSRAFSELQNPVLYFFGFLMLTEPKTAPIFKKGKFVYGAICAIFAFVLNFIFPASNFPLALLLANLFVPLLNLKVK